jgi:hypothetical protein
MRANRNGSRDPFTGVQIRIGVMGAASEPADPTVAALCRRLGRTVAERGACLLTGACPGLPHESVLGAKEIDGHVVGIGGRSGALGEFAIAYEEGKLIGVLTGTGGITEALGSIEASLRKDTGAEVIYDDDPARLTDRLLARYQSPAYVCPCWPDSGAR